MSAVLVCNDVPQVADGTALSGCTNVVFVDSAEVPTGFWAGVTLDAMTPVMGGILLCWTAAWGVRRIAQALGVRV